MHFDSKLGGAKDEEKVGDEPKPDETPEKDDEAAQPSEENPSEVPTQAAQNNETGSKDTVIDS